MPRWAWFVAGLAIAPLLGWLAIEAWWKIYFTSLLG
jgi:hypothetical protein